MYTKGQWKVVRSDKGKLPSQQPPAVKSGDDYIAILGGGSVHFRDAEANAKLISASPLLLEVLKKVVECDEAQLDVYDYSQLMLEAKEAIQQAEGE